MLVYRQEDWKEFGIFTPDLEGSRTVLSISRSQHSTRGMWEIKLRIPTPHYSEVRPENGIEIQSFLLAPTDQTQKNGAKGKPLDVILKDSCVD